MINNLFNIEWKRYSPALIILMSIHIFGWMWISKQYYPIINVTLLGLFGYHMFVNFPKNGIRFKFHIVFYLLGIVANIISAKVNNGQEIRDTALSAFNFYFIILYFYLHSTKLTRKEVENIVIFFGVLYAFLYLRQEDAFPHQFLYGKLWNDRGTIRTSIEGRAFHMFAYFLVLNRFLIERKLWQLALVGILGIVQIKSGYRTLIAGTVLCTGISYLKLVSQSAINFMLVIPGIIGIVILLSLPSYSYVFDQMVKTTEEQQEEGDDYIRAQQLEYFSTVYPRNSSYYIFGGGIPGAQGAYANYMGYITEEYGFFWVDLGLIGFYYVVGLLALLGILSYTLKAIFIKLPADAFYLHMFFLYLLLVSFTTMEIYRTGAFAVEGLALYLIDLIKNEEQGINQPEDIEVEEESQALST